MYYKFRDSHLWDDDLWLSMELNKIACMDCLEFLKQIPDESVDLVVTDPPYNISQKNDLKLNGRIIKNSFKQLNNILCLQRFDFVLLIQMGIVRPYF